MLTHLFRSYAGKPIPVPPRDDDTSPLVADGDTLFDLGQSVFKFGIAEPTLRQLYGDVMASVLTEADAAELGITKPTGALLVHKRVLSAADIDMMTANGMLPAIEHHRALFLAMVERSGADPLRKHIYFRYRKDHARSTTVFSVELKIDGVRAIAAMSGELAAGIGPRWSADGEKWLMGWPGAAPPPLARYEVKRRGRDDAFEGVANWESYAPKVISEQTGEEVIASFWQKMPDLMLGKVAEAAAYRRAFPELLSGLYIEEEMDQMENPPKQPDSSVGYEEDAQPPAPDDLDTQADAPSAAVPSTRPAVVLMSDEQLAHKLTLLGLSPDDQQQCITHYAGEYPKLYAEARDNFNNRVYRTVRAYPRRWTGRKLKLVAN